MGTKITRIQIRNYRGIKALDERVSGKGIIAKGRNGSGKTSFLKAIGTCLASEGADADAIRLGEKEGEILIDLDRCGEALLARRRMTPTKSDVSVTRDAESDHSAKLAKPTTLLAEILGSAPLDVVGLVLEKDKKKRRELVMQALPVRVTVEQLRRWIPKLPDSHPCQGHGLEVVAKLRQGAYERRTAANKAAEQAARTFEHEDAHAKRMRDQVPAGAGDHAAAADAFDLATKRLHGLTARREAAAGAEARLAGLRTQVETKRAEAVACTKRAGIRPTAEQLSAAREDCAALTEHVAAMQRKLDEAQADLREAERMRAQLEQGEAEFVASTEEAQRAEREALELEKSLDSAVDRVSDEEIAAAQRDKDAAQRALQAAADLETANKAEQIATQARQAMEDAKAEAARIDKLVQVLTTEAPAIILKESGGVEGLEIDGDDIRLNKVSLDHCCGAERMSFAAEIAKALTPNADFLVIDGLERIDPEQLDAFVAAATSGGRQLFGSLVDRGDLVLAHIASSDDGAEKAAE